ncbi:MAG: QcrA and Rieske domain-containing protein [Gammaproteobacteria bacterium]
MRDRPIQRRRLLQGVCAAGLCLTRAGHAQGPGLAGLPPGPAVDDLLVFAFGQREGETIAPDDLALGEKQVFAWAMEPGSGVVRNQTRVYEIVLIRLDPSWLSEQTAARAVDGIVAYTGFCTHTGCDVELWDAETKRFQCPCHESQFDPSDGARVVGGPAPWPLAALPLKLVDGQLAVAGPFEGRLGFQQQPGSGF